MPTGQPFGPGNILVDIGAYGGIGLVREFTPAGAFVREIEIPPADWAYAKDIAVAPNGNLVIFNGWMSPRLTVFDPVAETWANYTHPDWAIFGMTTLGAVAVRGHHAFVPDDTYGDGAEAHGLIRFDLNDGSSMHFASDRGYSELAVGFDGLVYALGDQGGGREVDVYDADTLVRLRSISMANVPDDWLYGMTVNAAGELYVARGPDIYRLDPDGNVLGSVNMTAMLPVDAGEATPWDLDVSLDGSRILYVGGVYLGTMAVDFSDPQFFKAVPADQQFGAMVNTAPVVPEINVSDPAPIPEGNAGITPVTFTVTLSAPTTSTVSVHYATQNGTATAGEDYTAVDGTLVFAPGETSKTVTVNVLGDRKAEADETFTLVLSSPVKGVLGDDSATAVIENDDVPPVAYAGPDRSVNENALLPFSAAGSTGSPGVPRTYLWDFGDGSTRNGFTVFHRYKDNGTFTARLTVRDAFGNEAIDTAEVTVNNVPPRGGLTGPAISVPGWARRYRFFGIDPGPIDRTALEYRIDWGDGQFETVTGPAAVTARHAYAAPGPHRVAVRIADKDGGLSPEYRHRVVVRPVFMLAGTVYVAGTAGDDAIEVRAANANGGVSVAVNGQELGPWLPSAVVVFAGSGNDTVTTVGAVSRRIVVDAGAGDDGIDFSSAIGPIVLVGGTGDDLLKGGSGRDVLVGGAGADTIDGGANDDVAIGGAVSFQNDPSALRRVSAEWVRPLLPYETRRDHLLGNIPGGRNQHDMLTVGTVYDDATVDSSTGGAGRDWFVSSTATPDSLLDWTAGETVTTF